MHIDDPPRVGLMELQRRNDFSVYAPPGPECYRIFNPPDPYARNRGDNWVVVTGFPAKAEMTEMALEAMTSFGRIVNKKWTRLGLHLQYSHQIGCERALEQSERIFLCGHRLRIYKAPDEEVLPPFTPAQCQVLEPPASPPPPQSPTISGLIWRKIADFLYAWCGFHRVEYDSAKVALRFGNPGNRGAAYRSF